MLLDGNLHDETAARASALRELAGAACARAGRRPDDVSIVAVTKTFGPGHVEAARAAGLLIMGESRIQEAAQKIPMCGAGLEWHMIGHLQRNKVRQVAGLFNMVHSVDSARLAEALDTACGDAGIEVNVAGEGSKFGIDPGDLPGLLELSTGWMNLEVRGLMTVPPFTREAEGARRYFAGLRELRDRAAAGSGIDLKELSMGMSHDFEVAIEEGATLVRVGSYLFGARQGAAGSAI